MKKNLIIAFIIATAFCNAQSPRFSSYRLIIKFKQTGIQSITEMRRLPETSMIKFGVIAIDALNAKYSCVSAKAMFPQIEGKPHPLSLQNIYLLNFADSLDIKALVQEYMSTGQLEYAQPDFKGSGEGVASNVVPDDPNFSQNWDLSNNGTFVITGGGPVAKAGADIKMECGWGITTGNTNVLIAVLDCGCQRSHPDLAGRIWENPHPGSLGYPNDLYGWDFAYGDSNVYDQQGHGTNVTGIIGANGNNGMGFAGMNWYCKIMTVKVDDNNSNGFTSNWALGVTYATDYGANIINMSLESESDDSIGDPTFQSAIDYAYSKGVLVVACMGNFDNSIPVAPADMSHVMAVGATTTNDWRAVPLGGTNSNALPGSCYNTYISVVAPGDEIYGLNNNLPDCYCWYWFGTSQACPHVVGLASLIMAVDPHLTNDQIRKIIEETADKGMAIGDPNDNPSSWNEYYGHGRINACRALDTVLLGVPDLTQQALSVAIYPNPFSVKAKLVIDNLHNTEQNIQAAIYDMQGREINRLNLINGQAEISGEGMSNGMYFYLLTSGQEILGEGKFMVAGK